MMAAMKLADVRRATVLNRFIRTMSRHLTAEDRDLTDDELVRKAFERYAKERKAPIVDVNE